MVLKTRFNQKCKDNKSDKKNLPKLFSNVKITKKEMKLLNKNFSPYSPKNIIVSSLFKSFKS